MRPKITRVMASAVSQREARDLGEVVLPEARVTQDRRLRVDEDGHAEGGRGLPDGVEALVVEVAAVRVGADLHGGEAQRGDDPLQLLDGQVRRLQRQPAGPEEARGAPADQLRDGVVLHAAPLGCGGAWRPVAEGGGRRGEQLPLDARPVHVLEAPRRIEGVRGERAVQRGAQVEPAAGGRIALQPRPAVAAVPGREVGPGAREDVGVDVDRHPERIPHPAAP
jgi:hypothetical protein